MRSGLIVLFLLLFYGVSYATPTTLIWTPSTDIQPYKKVHFGADIYVPTKKKDDTTEGRLYVQQVYGPVVGLPVLGKVMAETGFDYKKGFGPALDTYPIYFHFKAGVPEGAYFKEMPAVAVGTYDLGTKHNLTNNNVWYVRVAKTAKVKDLDLGRFSFGYFVGNGRLLRDKNGLRDDRGPMFAWERTMKEISDKLWVCADYQATQSAYGAANVGFAYQFTPSVSAIVAYDMLNNRNFTDTWTVQLDVNF